MVGQAGAIMAELEREESQIGLSVWECQQSHVIVGISGRKGADRGRVGLVAFGRVAEARICHARTMQSVRVPTDWAEYEGKGKKQKKRQAAEEVDKEAEAPIGRRSRGEKSTEEEATLAGRRSRGSQARTKVLAPVASVRATLAGAGAAGAAAVSPAVDAGAGICG